MIRQRELPCGCEEIERNGEKHTLYTCQQHGGGPLSFGRAFTQEGLRTLDSMSQAIRGSGPSVTSRAGTEAHRRVGMIPELAAPYGTPSPSRSPLGLLADILFDDAVALPHPVTQRVTIEPEELKLLRALVQCERITLLNERRTYVFARRGDTTRFNELIRDVDRKLYSVTRLGDKLSVLARSGRVQ
jgi:hypothetical protein